MMLRGPILAAAIAMAPCAVRAQTRADPLLPAKLGAPARLAIQRTIDSARASGLPVEPLADKAAEGVLKGADDERIVAAVETLARELGTARAVLVNADPSLLRAAASALHAGIDSAMLGRLARPAAAQPPDRQALTGALVTAVDLVAKHVPPAAATTSMEALLRRRAPEREFLALRDEVARDIEAGRAPEAALAARTRSHVQMLSLPPLDY